MYHLVPSNEKKFRLSLYLLPTVVSKIPQDSISGNYIISPSDSVMQHLKGKWLYFPVLFILLQKQHDYVFCGSFDGIKKVCSLKAN